MPSPRAADDARRRARPLRRNPRANALAVGAVTLAALLTACTRDAVAEPTPTRTVTASPTPEPTPTPSTTPAPVRPAAMDDPGVNGAVAAATYFMELFGYVGGGDLAEWKALSHPECGFCQNVATEVERMASVGHHQVGPRVDVLEARPLEITPGEFYGVDVDFVEHSWQELDADGGVVDERRESRTITIALNVVRAEGQWLIRSGETTAAK